MTAAYGRRFCVLGIKTPRRGNNCRMRKCTAGIEEVKSGVEALIGQKLKVSVNKGRKRVIRYDGEIDSVYPCVFVLKVTPIKGVSRLSFSYGDLICGDVKLKPAAKKAE